MSRRVQPSKQTPRPPPSPRSRARPGKDAVDEEEEEETTESVIVDEDEPDSALLEKMRYSMRSHEEG